MIIIKTELDCYDALQRKAILSIQETQVLSKATDERQHKIDSTAKQRVPSKAKAKVRPKTQSTKQVEPKLVYSKSEPRIENKKVNELGQKYLKTKQASNAKQNINLLLVDIDKDKQKRMVFTFENGQAWKQTEPRFVKRPASLPMQVQLLSGALGSFSVKLGENGRLVKVKRVR